MKAIPGVTSSVGPYPPSPMVWIRRVSLRPGDGSAAIECRSRDHPVQRISRILRGSGYRLAVRQDVHRARRQGLARRDGSQPGPCAPNLWVGRAGYREARRTGALTGVLIGAASVAAFEHPAGTVGARFGKSGAFSPAAKHTPTISTVKKQPRYGEAESPAFRGPSCRTGLRYQLPGWGRERAKPIPAAPWSR